MVDISDLIGIRYKDNGTDRNGYGCFGLAIEVCKRMGRDISNLDDIPTLTYALRRDERPKNGDIIMFFNNHVNKHIGVMLSDDDYIHCDVFGVRVSRISDIEDDNYEVYRWQY